MVTTTSELSTHRSTTDGDGAAVGTTVIDSALVAYPSFDGSIILIMSGDYRGQHRTIDGDTTGGTINLAKAFDGQIVEGINYIITSTVSPQRIDNLSYHATVSIYTNVTTFAASSLAGYSDDYFNDWYVYVVRDSAGAGAAPQGEPPSQISDYVSATGTFTHAAFTVPLAATDEILILHSTIGSIISSSTTIDNIFSIVNAILTLTETGGTITTDGALQSLYINNAPAGVFQPRKLLLDFTNHAIGDVMIIRTYHRLNAAGGLIKQDEEIIVGPQDPATITIYLEDNRFGYEITIHKTVGANVTYDWEVIYKI